VPKWQTPQGESDAAVVQRPQAESALQGVAEALLLCVTVLAYWLALRGRPLWDDNFHLTKLALRSLHGLWRIGFHLGDTTRYYPLLHSAFWVEYHLWGDAMLGYHLWNVVRHATSLLLVVRIVRRLGLPGALLAGFVFALHPVCVEAVAWMSEPQSTLSGVLYLASALAYLGFNETPPVAIHRSARPIRTETTK
jgi:protein O-mannosyl-transferase